MLKSVHRILELSEYVRPDYRTELGLVNGPEKHYGVQPAGPRHGILRDGRALGVFLRSRHARIRAVPHHGGRRVRVRLGRCCCPGVSLQRRGLPVREPSSAGLGERFAGRVGAHIRSGERQRTVPT